MTSRGVGKTRRGRIWTWALVAALGISAPFMLNPRERIQAGIIGDILPDSFSVCEDDPEDRPECQASDVRFQATTVDEPTRIGFAIATGDLNGDGLADLVAGDPERNRVYIYFGRGSVTAAYGLDPERNDRFVAAETQADVVLQPSAEGIGSFGFAVAVGRVQDSPGCGDDDVAAPLLIGAPGAPGTPSGVRGTAYYVPAGHLCLTPEETASATTLDPSEIGQAFRATVVEDDDEFGYSVAFGRLLEDSVDVYDDVIVGARSAAGGRGTVSAFPVTEGVVRTAPAGVAVIAGEEGVEPDDDGDRLGEALAVGDLDQDLDVDTNPFGDRDDLAVGGVGHDNGKLLVILGPLSPGRGAGTNGFYTESDDEVRAIVGEQSGDFFGFSVAISRDGRLAVGAIYAHNDPPADNEDADEATNVDTGSRVNAGKVYLWLPGVLSVIPDDGIEPATAQTVFVARRSGDQLGFALAFGDLNVSGADDLVLTARREDGSGLSVDEIDQGTAYIVFDDTVLSSPVDLNLCSINSDCSGVSGVDVMIFGGDRENDRGDEIGYAAAAGDFNGDGADDLFLSSMTQNRVYAVTLLDSDDDLDTEGRNLRDDDDDGDFDPDSSDCAPLDPLIFEGAPELPCNGIDENCNGSEDDAPDDDGDGFDVCGAEEVSPDCDDSDPDSFPDAPELCDGNDNPCAGSLPLDERDLDGDGYVECADFNDTQGDDENLLGGGDCDNLDSTAFPGVAFNEDSPEACMRDFDEDGYGDDQPTGAVTPGTDCDDDSLAGPFTFPGAAERESDTECRRDADEDGFGDVQAPERGTAGNDCDDADPASFPGAAEICDGNDNACDGSVDAGETDLDNDGYAACAGWNDVQQDDPGIVGGADCDDADPFIHPGAAPNEAAAGSCMRDADGDDFGDASPPPGVAAGTDCDDDSVVTFPGAAQIEGPLNCMKDADDDGYGDDSVSLPVVGGSDCDDDDPGVFFEAEEIPDDGIDQDCNGFDSVTCYEDLDRDGFGSTVTLIARDGDCDDPGESDLDTDCDDDDAEIHPGVAETPDDGIDQNCDGADSITCQVDGDRDGFGNAMGQTVLADDGSCDAEQGESLTADDCDDTDPASYPDAVERCDGNDNACAGSVDAEETDGDGDGYVECTGWDDVQGDDPGIQGGGDCDDAAADTFPGAAPNEVLPGECRKDADGDGYGQLSPPAGIRAGTDCDDGSATTFPGAAQIEAPLNCMKDADDDGYGDAGAVLPVVRGSDCDDRDPASYLGAVERCDGNDNSCSGAVAAEEIEMDGDGYVACDGWNDTQGDQPDVLGGGDCDETDPLSFPGAAFNEPFSSGCMRDQDGDGWGTITPPPGVTAGTDCDDASDVTFPGAAEAEAPLNCLKDADDDGWGDAAVVLPVVRGTDCNDDEPASNPGTIEGPPGNAVCSDAIDNDCDSDVDDDDSGCVSSGACPDVDDDGYADCTTDPSCDPTGLVCGDCDDSRSSSNPEAAEVCDNADNDCDGETDEDFDADGDGFTTCDLPSPDCDDGSPDVNPGTPEVCDDGLDNDCDETTPDIFDRDSDGATCDVDCDDDDAALNLDDTDDDSFSTCGGDCDDDDVAVNPGVAEVCNDGVDNDCNAGTPDRFDADGDGATCDVDCDDDDAGLNLSDADMDTFTSCAGDCNDDDDAVNPAAIEVCDGVDNNCDGTIDEDFDTDGDGYTVCGGDCDDTQPAVNPGLPETCADGLDNDCDEATPDIFDGDSDGSLCDVDCDDGDPTSLPGGTEVCDGNDNDCNGAVPVEETDLEGDGYVACVGWNDTQGDNPNIAGGGDCDPADAATFPGAGFNESFSAACVRDADLDGYGDQSPPAGITAGTDCDDASSFTFPGAAEIEAPLNCMRDADEDGWGDSSAGFPVVAGTDCDDGAPSANPGMIEGPPGDVLCSDILDNDCDGLTDDADAGCQMTGACPDVDDDGFADCVTDPTCDSTGQVCGDCDDLQPAASPIGNEVCDNVDNNCDGETDEGFDLDDDGFSTCALPVPDCDDGAPAVNPGAAEVCNDGIDNDCDAASLDLFDSDGDGATCDVDCDDDDASLNLADADADTFSTCDGDCNDGNADINPSATEVCGDGVDNDCDATTPDLFDSDGDGAACDVDCDDGDASLNLDDGDNDTFSTCDGDCDDGDVSVYPDAPELCDERDNDCDGDVDEGFDQDGDGFSACVDDCDDGSSTTFPGAAEVESATACMSDLDNDGYGDASATAPVTAGTDCDDTDPVSFPGAPERCDGNDNACGGTLPAVETDLDGDGYVTCAGWNDTQGDDGAILGGGDCDGSDALTFPGAAENESLPNACMRDGDGDGYGQLAPPPGVTPGTDCDDASDVTFPGAAQIEAPFNCMRDADDDGYGSASAALPVVAGTDCDDDAATAHPGLIEGPPGDATCSDALDNDCDSTVDDADSGCQSSGLCPDVDDDGFADCTTDPTCDDTGRVCGDCDDADPTVRPDASETCDNADNNCNGETDEGFDQDGDDFTICSLPVADCNDNDAAVYPGAPEVCDDAIDNDCDAGTPDIFDGDNDGATCEIDCDDGDPALNLDDADMDTFSSCAGDCNDADADIHPDATEVCDGVDNNCDGTVDESFDTDGDGYTVCDGDCNDDDPDVNPGAAEVCNDAVDNDCDAGTPDVFDADNDGSMCDADCDDSDPDTFPGAVEICDGRDNDCDSTVPSAETDIDLDGYVACDGWSGTIPGVTGGGDCDATSAATFPGAAPNETFAAGCMRDADDDDYGDLRPPAGVTAGTDCDDDSAATFPGAAEIEAPLNCMRDADDDGWGDATAVLPVVRGTDCDDAETTTFPGAPETCGDNVDSNCDGEDPPCPDRARRADPSELQEMSPRRRGSVLSRVDGAGTDGASQPMENPRRRGLRDAPVDGTHGRSSTVPADADEPGSAAAREHDGVADGPGAAAAPVIVLHPTLPYPWGILFQLAAEAEAAPQEADD